MNNLNYVTIGVLGSVLALGACSNNPDATQMLNTSSVQYKQEKGEQGGAARQLLQTPTLHNGRTRLGKGESEGAARQSLQTHT